MNTENPVTDLPDGLDAWRDAGTALGILYGQRTVQRLKEQAQDDALDDAIKEASHAQIVAAGLCICPDEEEIAAIRKKYSTPSGTLRDGDIPVQVVTLKPDAFDPLKAEVEGILGNLRERGVIAREGEPGMAMAQAVGEAAGKPDDDV